MAHEEISDQFLNECMDLFEVHICQSDLRFLLVKQSLILRFFIDLAANQQRARQKEATKQQREWHRRLCKYSSVKAFDTI